MEKFYFDTDDGFRRVVDDEGLMLPSAELAAHVRSALTDLVRETLPGGAERFAVTVRDQSGQQVCSYTLELTVTAS